jgi:hypothetical protein
MSNLAPLDLGSITPLDLGFDPRVHRMIVDLRRAPIVSVRYDKSGKSSQATGAPAMVRKTLAAAGYRIRWIDGDEK